MPRGSQLSWQEQAQIKALHAAGLSNLAISRQLKRHKSCIGRYLKDPSSYAMKKRSGRKRMLSAHTERRIIRKASNSDLTLNQIRSEVGTPASKQTILRTLKRSGNIVHDRLKPAPRLQAHHIKNRLDFARLNMNRDWSKVCY